MKAPLEGGTPEALFVGQNPSDVAVVSGAIYFVASDEDRGAIRKMPVSGGPGVKLADGWRVSDVAAAGALYWSDGDPFGTQKAGAAGVVMKTELDGSSSTQLLSGQTGLLAIAVDATNLYFLTGGTFNESASDGVVGSTPLAGGAPTILASDQSHPSALVVDGESVYWTTEGTVGDDGKLNADGAIMKLPTSGGTPTVLASGQRGPRALAVDDTSVYWTTYGATGLDGTVMKLTPK